MTHNLNQLKDTEILDSLDLLKQEVLRQQDNIRKSYQAISDEIESLGGLEALLASFRRVDGLASIDKLNLLIEDAQRTHQDLVPLIKDAEQLGILLSRLQESLDQASRLQGSLDQAIHLQGNLHELSLRLQKKEQDLIGVCESLNSIVDAAAERSSTLYENVEAAQSLQSTVEPLIEKGEGLVHQLAPESELYVRAESLLNHLLYELREDSNRVEQLKNDLVGVEADLAQRKIDINVSQVQLEGLEAKFESLQQQSGSLQFLLEGAESLVNLRNRLTVLESYSSSHASSYETLKNDVARGLELAAEADNQVKRLSTNTRKSSSSFEKQLKDVESHMNDLNKDLMNQKRHLEDTFSRKQVYILLGATLAINFIFNLIF